MTLQTPTLANVARLAGVSEITVSRVIRNKGPIAAETRTRVREAIDRLGYVPNRAAGSLASSASMLIGVVLPSLSNIVFPEVLGGIHAGLAGTAYQPLIGVTEYDPAVEQALVASILAWKPAAVLLTGTDHTEATRNLLAAAKCRVAELMDIDGVPIDIAIGLSHRRAGYASGRHLVSRGYRRFAYVGHDWRQDRRARLRYEGLTEALAEAGLSWVAERRHFGPSSTPAGRQALADLLASGAAPDVAVFSNDDMAIGGVFHCLADGIAIREKLGIFGFNGLEIGQTLPLALSSVRSNRFLIGRTAVERLLARPERSDPGEIIDTGFEILAGATA